MKVALKKRIIMMRRNYKLSLLVLLLAFASCSFTTKKFQDPNKDKLLIQLITYVLDKGHFSPQDINDDFSKEVFTDYLEQLDHFKRYFYASDMSEFETYKSALVDQIKAYDVTFFDITHERFLKRSVESKDVYNDVLSKRF
jgi:carboxyl-terminal processing protease